jgi:SAM-dependent methyltransferase
VADEVQVEAWGGDRVARWLRQAAGLERQLAPVSEVLFDAARLAPGESVLDVGCGTGPTTFAAALAVGPSGRVTGLDVSAEMLAAAADGAAARGDADAAPIDWLEADAVSWTPAGPPHDVVLSRFGVMFFSNPVAAFTNLARAARSGGRLAFAAWQGRDASELFAVPLHASVAALRSRGVTATGSGVDLDAFLAVDDDGPFSLHDANKTAALLERAGWTAVDIRPHVLELPYGGGVPAATAVEASVDFGPTRLLLGGIDDDALRAAKEAIGEAFAHHLDGDGHVVLSGAINIITATRD